MDESCVNEGDVFYKDWMERKPMNEAVPSKTVLEEAAELINGQRQKDYGSALDSFTRIGKIWSAILDIHVGAEEVALCLIGLKVSRATQGWKRDSIIDIAGYAGCLEMIQAERAAQWAEAYATAPEEHGHKANPEPLLVTPPEIDLEPDWHTPRVVRRAADSGDQRQRG